MRDPKSPAPGKQTRRGGTLALDVALTDLLSGYTGGARDPLRQPAKLLRIDDTVFVCPRSDGASCVSIGPRRRSHQA